MCAILRRCSLLTKKAALAALAPIDSGFSGPRRTIAVPTREAYPKQRRVVKKQSRMLGNTPAHRVCYTLNATNACCNSQAKGVRV